MAVVRGWEWRGDREWGSGGWGGGGGGGAGPNVFHNSSDVLLFYYGNGPLLTSVE